MCGPGHDAPAITPPPDEADRLHAIWHRLGIEGPVDVHVHFLPRSVMDKVWLFFDRVGEVAPFEWPITYRTDEATRLDTLRAFGVQRFTSLVYPHKPDMAQWLNTWSRAFAEQHPDCLSTGTFFAEERAATYVAEAIAAGTQIFKSHIQVGEYSPDDPLLDEVWGQLSEARIPTVIHAGSGPAPGRFTGPGPVAEVLRRHPDLPLIVAHMGLPEYDEFLDLAERYAGVHLDTTMAFTEFTERHWAFPAASIPRLVDLGDRIVWGSDFPNIPYAYLHAVEALEQLDLGDDWLRGVFSGNATRLLGLA